MYAIVQAGGKQYRVETGDTILVNRMKVEKGAEVVLDKVLMVGGGETVTVGRPVVEGASVTAEVIKHTRGPKLVVFKKTPKKGYKKTQGHRQDLVELKIKSIKEK